MAKISHHGSCRWKSSNEFKCICFEKGNRWDGKCWTRQCKTHEIRQCLYRSGNKTTMQKSPEDNQATGLFTCESFTTQNPKFIKLCHQMRGTGQDGRRRNQKTTSTTRNHCCQKDIHTQAIDLYAKKFPQGTKPVNSLPTVREGLAAVNRVNRRTAQLISIRIHENLIPVVWEAHQFEGRFPRSSYPVSYPLASYCLIISSDVHLSTAFPQQLNTFVFMS